MTHIPTDDGLFPLILIGFMAGAAILTLGLCTLLSAFVRPNPMAFDSRTGSRTEMTPDATEGDCD